MKKNIKLICSVIAVIMIFAAFTCTALAAGRGPQGVPQGGPQGGPQSGQQNGAQPPQGDRQPPQGNGQPQGERPDDAPDPDGMTATSGITETINALEDSDVKTNLLALLSTYETALASKKTAEESGLTGDDLTTYETAVTSAKDALDAALTAAGIELPQLPDAQNRPTGSAPQGERPDGDRPSGDRPDGDRPDGDRPDGGMMNVEAVRTAVEALEDSDSKTNLLSLLSTYEAALAAKKAGLDADSDSDTMATLRQAVTDAKSALDAALEAAGVEVAEPDAPQGEPRNGQRGQAPGADAEALRTAIEALEASDSRTSLLTLMTAYETALDAEKAALDSNADSTALEALRETTAAAREALISAMETAGIEVPESTASADAPADAPAATRTSIPKPNKYIATTSNQAQASQQAANVTATAQQTSGIGEFFQMIADWFTNLFSF